MVRAVPSEESPGSSECVSQSHQGKTHSKTGLSSAQGWVGRPRQTPPHHHHTFVETSVVCEAHHRSRSRGLQTWTPNRKEAGEAGGVWKCCMCAPGCWWRCGLRSLPPPGLGHNEERGIAPGRKPDPCDGGAESMDGPCPEVGRVQA